jgi:anti-anti-sigma regulatory factor
VAGEYTLRPAGELDFEQAQRLRPQWLAALAEHEPDTLVVVLVSPSPRIRKVLALTGLDQVFPIRAARPQASSTTAARDTTPSPPAA